MINKKVNVEDKIKAKTSLENKLNTIHKTKLLKFEDGEAKTIKDFYDKFIEPRLPKDINCIIKWHKLLLKYICDDNVVFILYYYCFNICICKITFRNIALSLYEHMNNEHCFISRLVLK